MQTLNNLRLFYSLKKADFISLIGSKPFSMVSKYRMLFICLQHCKTFPTALTASFRSFYGFDKYGCTKMFSFLVDMGFVRVVVVKRRTNLKGVLLSRNGFVITDKGNKLLSDLDKHLERLNTEIQANNTYKHLIK